MSQPSRSPRRRPIRGKRFVLVASRFNPSISAPLRQGALDVLRRAGVTARQIRTVWVPGAFELPAAAARVAATRPKPHAIIALGALIRGQTPQYAAIAHAAAEGLALVSVNAVIPVTLGVIVADSMAQAKARAGPPTKIVGGGAKGPIGNRGAEAAMAALEMVRMFHDGRIARSA